MIVLLPKQKPQQINLRSSTILVQIFFLLFMFFLTFFPLENKGVETNFNGTWKMRKNSPPKRVEEIEYAWPHRLALASFKEVTAHIMKTQFPLSCENSCYYSLSYNHLHGFGSRAYMMAAALSVALEKGCILIGESKNAVEWSYNYPLEPLTNCSVSSRKLKKIGKEVLQKVLMRHTPKISDLNISITVWRTAAISFLLRPTRAFDSIINRAISESIWQKDCDDSVVGIHVRHNDKGSEAKLLPFSLYLEEIANWENFTKTQVKCLFIATDDVALKKDIIARHQKDEGSAYKIITLDESNINKLSKFEQLLLELHLLSRTNSFAFTFSSNFGQLAMFLNPRNLEHTFSSDKMPKLIPLDFYQRVKFGPRSISYGYFFTWDEGNANLHRVSSWIVLPVMINDVRKVLSCDPARAGCSYDSRITPAGNLADKIFCKDEDCSCCKLFPRFTELSPYAYGPNISRKFPENWVNYAH